MKTLSNLHMSRRNVLKAGIAAATVPAFARFGYAADKTYTMRIADAEGIGTPIAVAFGKWAEILNQRSDGRIKASYFPAGQLGGLSQLLDASRIGTIQATTAGPDSEESIAPEIAAFGGAPGFIYQDEAHVDRVLQGELGQEVSDIARKKTGVEFVAYGETGFRHILSKPAVLKLDDLKGLKIRVPELKVWVDFWTLLGASPTPLPYSEQYSALSSGIIDALDSDVFSIIGFKFYEAAKNLTLTGHWFLPKAVRVNAAWLDSLPPDLQELVRSSAKEVFAEQRATNRAGAAKALDDLQKLGVEVHKLPPEERAKMEKLTAPLYDAFGSKSPETAAMIKKIIDLRS